MTVSNEMSFSLSRLRSTLRSMSIAASSKVRFVGKLQIGNPAVKLFQVRVVRVVRPPELHLDSTRPQVVVREPALGAVHVHRDTLGVRREYPALDGSRRSRLDPDQPARGPSPVSRLGQRPVHSR